jgi:hypothetical protein
MYKLFKWLLVLAFAFGLAAGASYAAARVTVGKFVGPRPPLSGRTMEFSFGGVERLPGNPRAWVITYRNSQLPGVRQALFYVSPTGKLLTALPADLDVRLEAWAKSQEP